MSENINNGQVGKDKILHVDVMEINKPFIEDMFASYHDKESNTFKEAPFQSNTHIKLSNKEYKYVKGEIETTIGLLLFNRYVLERTNIIQHIGYWNKPITQKECDRLATEVNNLIINNKIEMETLGEFIDSRDRLGFWCSAFLASSITPVLVRPMHDVNKRKQELFKEHKAELESDDAITQLMASNKIEKELIGMVRKNVQSDSGYDMYASGTVNFENNYKNINVMRGAVFNDGTKKFDIVESSLMNGIKKKDIPASANSIVAGAYPSAVGTAEAGYMAKIVLAILQSISVSDDETSDCGTNITIPVTINEHDKQYFLYRNFNINGKKVMTTLNNIDQFVGKTLQMYSPQCCLNDKICAKCSGKVFQNLGVTNAGLLTTEITQKLLNLKLKSKHDLSQKADIINRKFWFLDDNKYVDANGSYMHCKTKMKLFIPRLMDKQTMFEIESTYASCMGVMPVKFYDNNDKELLSTTMSIPAILSFNIYEEIQETPEYIIIPYEADSNIANMAIRQTVANVEYFLNQIYLYSDRAQVPYDRMTDLMFRCLEINKIDLTGPSIVYEFLARRLCRTESGNDSFAKIFGKKPGVDPLSYKKVWFREAVQTEGITQGLLFQDVGKSINVGLSQTINGVKPVETPIEKVIKS